MSIRNTKSNYGTVAKFFHWLIFILLFFMIIFGYLLDDIPKEYKPIAYNIHKLTGLTILVLIILRAIWALMNPKPSLKFTANWQLLAERSMHWLLYLAVIVMPLAGWIGSSAEDKGPHLGNLKLQLPIAQSKDLSDVAFTIHGWTAIAIIVLVSIHVIAAFYHHFYLKDNVLKRMLP